MAITFVASAYTDTATTTASTATLAIPESAQAGDVVLAFFNTGGGAGATLTPPTNWVQQARQNVTTGTTAATFVFRYVVQAGDPGASFTWTWDSARAWVLTYTVYRGVDNTTPVDISAGNNMTMNTPTVTTTAATDLLVTVVFGRYTASGTTWTVTWPGSMTKRTDNVKTSTAPSAGISVADEALTVAGATGTRAFTSTQAFSSTTSFAIALKAATVTSNPVTAASADFYSDGGFSGAGSTLIAAVLADHAGDASFSGFGTALFAGIADFSADSVFLGSFSSVIDAVSVLLDATGDFSGSGTLLIVAGPLGSSADATFTGYGEAIDPASLFPYIETPTSGVVLLLHFDGTAVDTSTSGNLV